MFGLNSEESRQSVSLCEAALMIEDLAKSLLEKAEEIQGHQGVNKWLECAVRSVKAEQQKLRQHLEREDEEQVIQSVERLLRKIARLRRRFKNQST